MKENQVTTPEGWLAKRLSDSVSKTSEVEMKQILSEELTNIMPGATQDEKRRLAGIVEIALKATKHENRKFMKEHDALIQMHQSNMDRSFREQVLRADAQTRVFLNELMTEVRTREAMSRRKTGLAEEQ